MVQNFCSLMAVDDSLLTLVTVDVKAVFGYLCLWSFSWVSLCNQTNCLC